MKMVFGSCEAKNGHANWSQRKGTECLMGTVLGQSTICHGTALYSPKNGLWTEIVHVKLLACY